MCLIKKNVGKGIHIGFPYHGRYYIYPHDEIMKKIFDMPRTDYTGSWIEKGEYNWETPPQWALKMLAAYEVTNPNQLDKQVIPEKTEEYEKQQTNDDMNFIKVQIKNRMWLGKIKAGKDIHIAFPCDGRYYIYPHDEIMEKILKERNVGNTISWCEDGIYNWASPPKWAQELIAPYEVTESIYNRAKPSPNTALDGG